MSSLTLLNSSVSMTSREIAELTGKEHKNVLRDIDTILETIGSELSQGFKSTTYVDEGGRTYRQFELDRDSSYCLMAGYDVNSRMRIIKRWQELEAGLLPPDYPTALRALAAEVEQRQRVEEEQRRLRLQVEADKPYTELAKAITGSSTITRRDWLALMKEDHATLISEKKLTAFLIEHGYCYRDQLTKSLRAYAHSSHLFKLEYEVINGSPRPLLKVTGDGVLLLTPVVIKFFNP